jgi:hypothetical protein
MKHWDLFPHETVTLSSRGERIRARFLFRDTAHAAFEIEGNYWELSLREDGDLLDREQAREWLRTLRYEDYDRAQVSHVAARLSRVWQIEALPQPVERSQPMRSAIPVEAKL